MHNKQLQQLQIVGAENEFLQQHDVQLIDIIVSINGVQMNYKY
jgi:hypothetical protein